MSETYNVYCDESCHLTNDGHGTMVLGAVWCPAQMSREIAVAIRQIKASHGVSQQFEIKWTKVSPAKVGFYHALLDYFFDNTDLHFRALVVADKTQIRREDFGPDHDDWYYQLYFDMLKILIAPTCRYRIYIDIKDTLGRKKILQLREALANAQYDFDRKIIERMQLVKSDEVEQQQLVDLLIGCVGYANRGLTDSSAKASLVQKMQDRSRYSLTKTTLLREQKVNIFKWHAQELGT